MGIVLTAWCGAVRLMVVLQGLVEGQAGLARTSVSGHPARRAPAAPNGVPSTPSAVRRAPPPPPK